MAAPRKVRGRTAAGRLRGVEALLLAGYRDLIERPGGRFADVGFGERPDTTLELAVVLSAVNPDARVVGFEVEPHRVQAAAGRRGVEFVLGGFDEVARRGRWRVIRAMNVLRGYRPDDLPGARQQLRGGLEPDGLLVEGSSDDRGDVLTAHLFRANRYDGLFFFTSFARGFAPRMFRDWLPRELRRTVRPGTEIHALFERWTASWEAHPRSGELPELFARSARDAGLELIGPGMAVCRSLPPPI